MKRCCLLLLLVLCAPCFAKDAKEGSSLTWSDFPIRGLPEVPAKLPKDPKRRDAIIAHAQKAQQEFLKKKYGEAKFFGLCEVRSVKPIKEEPGKFLVFAREARDLTSNTISRSELGGWRLRCVEWTVAESRALQLAPEQRFNISGTISSISAEGNGVIDSPLKITIHIEKAKGD